MSLMAKNLGGGEMVSVGIVEKGKANSNRNSGVFSDSWGDLFLRLAGANKKKIEFQDIRNNLERSGIFKGSATFDKLEKFLGNLGENELSQADFEALLSDAGENCQRALSDDLAIKNFPAFCEEIQAIFEKTRDNKTGDVASYIPQLARVDPEKYAASVCTVDGQRFCAGDTTDEFCLQSVSKPISYCMAVENLGLDKVHTHVGREPSGRGFNAFAFDPEGRPHNPMINSGAIMTASLLNPEMEASDRFDKILETWRDLSGGGRVGFDNPTYLSEKSTADRNHALAYFMRENKAFPEGSDIHQVLDLYFQICSITVDSQALASVAATLANGGVNPLSGQRIFHPETVRSCLSLMYSCGMYDYSGEFAFKLGLPAKSGVSGCLMVIIPNVMGLCVWSPRLDKLGNTVRGIDFTSEMVKAFDYHIFDQLVPGLRSHSDAFKGTTGNEKRHDALLSADLFHACASGELKHVRCLMAKGVNINEGDYDGRTPLHLAASEGHGDVVKYLLDQGADLSQKDRWGNKPVDDAKREGHSNVAKLLCN